MQANSKSLSSLLTTAKRYIIPEYQRPYCWTKEEVEQLWNDLDGAYRDYVGKPSPKTAEDYFLGPIVVANAKDTTGAILANVVDGQQRLTMLHSLLWCIMHDLKKDGCRDAREKVAELERYLTTPSGEATLAVAFDDQANFHALRTDTALDETRELGVAGRYFRKQLSELRDADVIPFTNYVLNQTTFIIIETESYGAAWELFIGLNAKGRKLSPADLIKAFVCGTSADSRAMADIWVERVLPLGDDATSTILDITRVGTGEVGSDAKLFKLFQEAWDKKDVTAPLLANGARAYQLFWHEPLEKISHISEAGVRALRGLRQLNRRDHTPVLVAFAAKHGFETIFHADLLHALEAYQLWMAIRGRRGRERNFTSLAHSIYHQQCSRSDALAELRSLLERLAPPVDEVRTAIASAAYRGRIMLFICRSYEEGMRGDIRIDDVQYEHIMPVTPTPYWYAAAGTDDPNDYSRLVNNIGNIVPLDARTNIDGSNEDWVVKRDLYEGNVPNWLAASIARSNPDAWTRERIESRATEIADWATMTRWNFREKVSRLPMARVALKES